MFGTTEGLLLSEEKKRFDAEKTCFCRKGGLCRIDDSGEGNYEDASTIFL